MKKIMTFIFLLFSICCFTKQASALSFAEAPTLNDYIKERGTDKLEHVIFSIARLRFGATAVDWDELENKGAELLKDFTAENLAEFIFINTYEYKLTKTAFEIIMDSMKADYAIADKNYLDVAGNYKPLNADLILANRGLYIDIANLFEAKNIVTTTKPYEIGYEYQSDNSLYINKIDMNVKNTHLNTSNESIPFEVVQNSTSSSGRFIPLISSIGSIYNYSYTAVGFAQDYSFFRVNRAYSNMTDLRNLTGMEITIRIGDMEKSIKGAGTIAGDLELDHVYSIDPDERIDSSSNGQGENGGGENGESDNGNWWDWLSKLWDWITNVLTKFLDSVLAFFDWIKDIFEKLFQFLEELLIPDFSGFEKKIDESNNLFKKKFASIFEVIEQFKSLFKNGKSLHDIHFIVLEQDFYPFPRETTEEAFKLAKLVINAILVLCTLIACYKRCVGEGDLIE